MPFQKGHKFSGSRKGIKNKRTIAWEKFTEFCMEGGLEKFVVEMKTLKGGMYTGQFLNLLEFHKPRLARTEMVGDEGKPIELNISNLNFKIKTKGESNK